MYSIVIRCGGRKGGGGNIDCLLTGTPYFLMDADCVMASAQALPNLQLSAASHEAPRSAYPGGQSIGKH